MVHPSMSSQQHYVIIGTGLAGNEAAAHLRERDPDGRITMITQARLLYIRRFDFFMVFTGTEDWRELLVEQPDYYQQNGITLRRDTRVTSIDPERQSISLEHKEEIHYDKLLIATGGGGYVPEDISEYSHLLSGFSSYEDALLMRRTLPEGGMVLMLGGDMMGIDLARHLVGAGYRVTLVAGEQLFWPHKVSEEDFPEFIAALEKLGIEVVLGKKVSRIEEGARGLMARRVVIEDGGEIHGDAVVAFCGLVPPLGFLGGSGLDVQRGLLVNQKLATSNNRIWAAGDVCQIWSPEDNQYRFCYEWRNVKNMGLVAAINMTGGTEAVDTVQEGGLYIDEQGEMDTPFWDQA